NNANILLTRIEKESSPSQPSSAPLAQHSAPRSAAPILVTGTDAGGSPQSKVLDARTGDLKLNSFAYDLAFAEGGRVAVGDVNGAGIPDIITAAESRGMQVTSRPDKSTDRDPVIMGASRSSDPQVHVLDALTLAEVYSFFAHDPLFRGG